MFQPSTIKGSVVKFAPQCYKSSADIDSIETAATIKSYGSFFNNLLNATSFIGSKYMLEDVRYSGSIHGKDNSSALNSVLQCWSEFRLLLFHSAPYNAGKQLITDTWDCCWVASNFYFSEVTFSLSSTSPTSTCTCRLHLLFALFIPGGIKVWWIVSLLITFHIVMLWNKNKHPCCFCCYFWQLFNCFMWNSCRFSEVESCLYASLRSKFLRLVGYWLLESLTCCESEILGIAHVRCQLSLFISNSCIINGHRHKI